MLRHTLQAAVIVTFLSGSIVSGAYAQDAAQDKESADAAAPSAKAADAKTPDAKTALDAKDAKAPADATAAAPAPAAAAAPAQPAAAPADVKDQPKVSTDALEPKNDVKWRFNGMGGYVDKQAAQRGFQIYSQVCSACHSMNLVAYRNLGALGFSDAEIKAIASQKQVEDLNDSGDRMQRPGKPFDHFVPPYPNEKASRAANNGAYPPDLSLIIKARDQGPDYVYSLLTGFGNPPANEPPVANKYYNPYFQGHWISMPPPLHDGVVTYQDGTNANVDQMARDVVTFLQWAAEPEMEARHEMGIKALIFLIVMTGLLYVAKKRVWKNLK